MLHDELQALVGSTVLSDVLLEELVDADDALGTFRGRLQAQGRPCTVRIALKVAVEEQHTTALAHAMLRLKRHAVGIAGLCAPLEAGVVQLGSQPRLAMAHDGPPIPSAKQRLADHSALPWDKAYPVLQALANTLGVLHDQGLVHGALQPSLVLFDGPQTRLSGFGLSELASLLHGANGTRDVVSALHRAPEQVGAIPSPPCPETDTYGLALLGSELLAGRPFTDLTDPIALARAIDDPITRPTPRSLLVSLPDAIEKAFSEALQLFPNQRPADPRLWTAKLQPEVSPVPTQYQEPAELPLEAPKPPPISQSVFQSALPQGPAVPEQTPPQGKPQLGVPPIEQKAPPPLWPPAMAPSIAQKPSRSDGWLIYGLLGAGVLLLLGGVGVGFLLVLRAPKTPPAPPAVTATSPIVTAPAMPKRPVTPKTAETTEEPAPVASGPNPFEDTKEVSRLYPEEATALIPLSASEPILGSREAPVTIVLFADMQCPYTRQARITLEKLASQYKSNIRIAIRQLPLNMHSNAEQAAAIATITQSEAGSGAFWKVFRKLTDNQESLTDASMISWAEEAGVPKGKVEQGLKDKTYQASLEQDKHLAGQLMIRGTPTLFINGKRINGMLPQARLAELIEQEIKDARATLAGGTPQNKLYGTRVRYNVTAATDDEPEDRGRSGGGSGGEEDEE